MLNPFDRMMETKLAEQLAILSLLGVSVKLIISISACNMKIINHQLNCQRKCVTNFNSRPLFVHKLAASKNEVQNYWKNLLKKISKWL